MHQVNYRAAGDKLFIAKLEDTEIAVYAAKPSGAMQKAIEYFKPKKRERELIEIRLKG